MYLTRPSLTLRPARAGESDAISELAFASKAHWDYSLEFMEACRDELRVTEAQLADASRHTGVAQADDGTLAGYYALAPLDDSLFDLDAMFVDPRFIGQGVGGALLAHAKVLAAELGADALMIQSDPNTAAFYRAAGAVDVSVRESGSIPGRLLPELRLPLCSPLVGTDPNYPGTQQ